MPPKKLYAILSDVHGNEAAFSTVLAYLQGTEADAIFCLGDLVGYGQGAAACVKLAQKHNVQCIQGNHDAQVKPPRDPRMREEAQASLDLALTQLGQEQVEWLQRLPTSRVVDDHMVLVHGALTGRDDYILTKEAVEKNLQLLAQNYTGIRIAFFGHTHIGMVVGGGKIRTRFPESDVVPLEPGHQYLVNPGSVGQPRDEVPLASFVLYDAQDAQVMVIRIEYDIEAEQEQMRKAGLPDKLWRRLSVGK